jgi:hypothetical protein
MKGRNVEVPDRRQEGSGRRAGDPKKAAPPQSTTENQPPPPEPPKTNEQRPEVEPDRRHFLHKKVGGKKAA